jgi:hypothetical protein
MKAGFGLKRIDPALIKNIVDELEFELNDAEINIENFIKYYKYYPQYFEGLV